MRYYIALFVIIIGGALGVGKQPLPVKSAPAPAATDLPPGQVISQGPDPAEMVKQRLQDIVDDPKPVDSVRVRGADGVEREIRDPEQIARLRKAQNAVWEAHGKQLGYDLSPRPKPEVNFAPGAPMVDPAGQAPNPTPPGTP